MSPLAWSLNGYWDHYGTSVDSPFLEWWWADVDCTESSVKRDFFSAEKRQLFCETFEKDTPLSASSFSSIQRFRQMVDEILSKLDDLSQTVKRTIISSIVASGAIRNGDDNVNSGILILLRNGNDNGNSRKRKWANGNFAQMRKHSGQLLFPTV